MSWLKDPELFLEFYDSEIRIWRLRRKSGSPIEQSEFTRESNITNYLSLVDSSFQWKKSDFDALSDILYKNDILVNCQGLVLTITFPRGRPANNHPDMSHAIRFWSLDVVNLSRYGLPAPTIPFREAQYIEGGCAPVQPSPKENELAAKLRAITHERYREKAQKHALDEKVLELEAMSSTFKDVLQREKDEKQSIIDDRDALENEKHELQKRVCDMGAKIAILDDELKKEKDEKKAVIIERDGEKAAHEALKKRVSELEATNATLNDKLQFLEAEEAAKQAIVEVLNSEASSSTLKVDLHIEKDETTSIISDLEQVEAEKQDLEKRVADLEATNAALNDELKKLKNDKDSLIKKLDGHEADKQASETVCDSEASITLNDELQKEKDDLKLITNDRDRLEAEKQALEKRVSELEAANATLNDDLQREKNDMNSLIKYLESQEAEKEALEKKVSDLEATNATLNDELKREKDSKNALVGAEAGKQAITEVSSLEATSSSLKVDMHIEKVDDKEALEKRISELEALNATLKDELQKEKDAKDEKQGSEKTVPDLQATNDADDKKSIMNDLDRVKAEKQVLEKKVSELETKYAALNSELLKKEEDKKAILNDKDGHEAEKQALEKIVFDLEATKVSLNVEIQELKNDNGTPISEEAEKQALKKRISDLEATISSLEDKAKKLTEDINIWLDEISELQEEVNQENKAKQALEKKVAELTLKLEKCTCGAAEESPTTDKKEQKEPWMNDSTVPTNWVPYEELVQAFSRSSPLAMTKACECDSAGLSEDSTTNIQVHYFYRGSLRGRPYPVIVVKVEELIPNKEKARFDPSVWGLFNNAGTCYAARKPFESEM
ncbi:hypothetical protein MKW98_006087 [Papaver atlanticum]|uniref:Uncharacterized protein n=1 Tax=Papaver atlanticum TaxID=357466 RepID=A0AAD4TGA2_9MAGN|nr:hypothetical protein MKW98_006087 [Papaver atlanticum]